MRTQLYPALAGTVGFVLDNIPPPTNSRKPSLNQIVTYLKEFPDARNLIFVCTHNSRRSHLAQYWAAVAAAYYNVSNVQCYSGGTERTALNINTIDALLESSFEVRVKQEDAANPRYEVLIGGHIPAMEGFSKTISESPNPTQNFCAVMVCSDADEGCPFVTGASSRVSLPYEDPKSSDETPDRRRVYHQRSLEIGRDMLWVFEQVAEN